MHPKFKYYLDTALFNVGFSFLIGVISFSPVWGLLMLPTFGNLIGFLGFEYFRKPEYYFYYNLGYTRKSLMIFVFLVNLVVAALGLGLLFLVLFATLKS